MLVLICECYHITIGELLRDFRPVRCDGSYTPISVLCKPRQSSLLSDREALLLRSFRSCMRKEAILEFAQKILQEDAAQTDPTDF